MKVAPPVAPLAAERVAQTITVVAGVATIAFFALSLAPIVATFPYLNPAYGTLSAIFVFGMPVVVALASRRLHLAALKRALGVYAIGFLVVVIAWVPAMTSTPLPGVTPWPLEITALATVPAAIAWRPSIAWGYLVLNSLLIAPVRWVAAGNGDLSIPLQYSLFTLTFSAIFTALALIAMKNGYALDVATTLSREQAVRLVAVTAHENERARLDALVHDEVTGTLYYASQGDAALTESVRKQAASALQRLDEIRANRDRSDPSAAPAAIDAASMELVQFVGIGPRVMIWSYFATMAVLAVWNIDHEARVVPTLAGLTLFALVTLVASRDESVIMTRRAALLVVLVWPLITLLVSWQLTEYGGFAQWYFGAATVSLFYIGLRGRIWFAWIGFALVSGVAIAWGATTATGAGLATMLVAKQLPILIAGTLFAVGIRRASARIMQISADATDRASREASTIAVTIERNRALARLDAFAAPLLTKIVDGPKPTALDLVEFAIAEAELRDAVRARGLSMPPLTQATRSARRRGVDVVLLDDSDQHAVDPRDVKQVIAAVHSALESATSGRVVARLLPPDRADAATLVIDDGPNSRYESIARTSRNTKEPATA